MTTTLPVNEVFGPTFQGEGPHTGRRCYFVRLGHCNLHCAWCDTPYTWDRTRYDLDAENPDLEVGTIGDRLAALMDPWEWGNTTDRPVVVLSGGEPLIHHPRLPALFDAFPADWHVESNGTIPPPPWWSEYVTHTTLSPKVAQDDDPWARRIKPRVLQRWAELRDVAWKFVVRTESDLDVVEALRGDLDLPRARVWIMPEGVTPGAILTRQAALSQAVTDRGYNLTTRLHTLLWGTERGR